MNHRRLDPIRTADVALLSHAAVPALLLAIGFLGLGCSSSDSGAGTSSGTTPSDDVGISIESAKFTLQPGEEKYLCWSAEVPDGAELPVTGIRADMPTGIHHYQVTMTTGAVPADGAECESAGMGTFLAVGGPGTPPLDYPSGTALMLPAKTRLILQLHVLNLDSAPREMPVTRVDMLAAKSAEGLTAAGVLLVNSSDIDIPKGAKGVTTSGGCALTDPIEHIFSIWPHMHLLGQHVTTDVVPASGGTNPLVDIDWNFEQQDLYPMDKAVKAGDRMRVSCTYDNPTDKDVHFGMSTHDEMCAAFVYYYPAKSATAFCDDSGGMPPPGS